MQLKHLGIILAALVWAAPLAVSAATVVYLTSGTSWTVPSNWNSASNTIEVIGGGGGGTAGNDSDTGAGGGGGGAYSKTTNLNLTPGGTAYMSIGTGGTNASGGDTWFNNVNSAATSTTGGALAKGGLYTGTTAGGAGGAATSGVGTTKNSGGHGGAAAGSPETGGGGGGAGSVTAVGGTGSDAPGGESGGSGGAGSGTGGGTSGAAGDPANDGGAGGNGTNWDGAHGSGGGGGGGGMNDGDCYAFNGGPGGNYGGGGGGGSDDGCEDVGSGGSGKQGLIVITYTVPSSSRSITVAPPISVTGNVSVIDNLTKGSGTFLIDDPADPADKLLYHSFVESPDALDEYASTTVIGGNGEAVVQLPDYFEALNGDYQYFVRPVDTPMGGLYIKQEVKDNSFVIAGGTPGGEVSWMVTGVRHDPYILAHPIVPEVEKGPGQLVDKDQYLFAGNAPSCSTLIGCAWNFLTHLF